MNECTLGVHEIELMIKTSPSFGNGGRVAQHANSTLDLGQITTRNNGRWLVVNTNLETSWTPIDELQEIDTLVYYSFINNEHFFN